MPKNVGDLGKLIVTKGLKKLPKVKKSPNLVTLHVRKLPQDPLYAQSRIFDTHLLVVVLTYKSLYDCGLRL